MSATPDDKMAATAASAAAVVAPNSVDDLFRFYRLTVGRTYFVMLLATQIVYHVVYVVLRRTLSTEVPHRFHAYTSPRPPPRGMGMGAKQGRSQEFYLGGGYKF